MSRLYRVAEALLCGQGYLLVAWLYLHIVLSPTLLCLLLLLLGASVVEQLPSMTLVYGVGGAGALAGLFWAERIRRTLGIINFHAYLLSTPEIDGWRDGQGRKLTRSSWSHRAKGQHGQP
ncbi:hypothetical protein [Ferrimonas futtsuensis]|uniref:hypothetical protein n=1 Tax=Ferrimonas futtsuensis TaxID=364764 RepID=UPI0004271A5B|nr:hypothetical protein [Ferrimonas futtsuensis]